MLIREVSAEPVDSAKLAALSQFLLGRAKDTDAEKTISTSAFMKLANSMNISLTQDQLVDLSQQPPLSNIIANVEGDTVVFRGADSQPGNGMTVDQARDTVDNMAKRAAKKGL